MRGYVNIIWLTMSLVVISCSTKSTYDLAINNVNIIDIETGDIVSSQNIGITSNRISVITENVIQASDEVDASGQFVIPGLYDMHAHILYSKLPQGGNGIDYPWSEYLNLMLASGITGYRDMWGEIPLAQRVRKESREGKRLSPRFTITGNFISNVTWFPGSVVITDTMSMKPKVDSLIDLGVEYLKVFNLEPEVFRALMSYAKEREIEVVGHVPRKMRASEVSTLGLRSFEHLMGVVAECATGFEEFLELAQTEIGVDITLSNHPLLTELDIEACTSLAQLLKENETWIVPTMILADTKVKYIDDSVGLFQRPYVKNLSKSDIKYMKGNLNYYHRTSSEERWQVLRDMRAMRLKVIKLLNDNGVGILAGSDLTNPLAAPGFSIYKEVSLFREAGLSPLEALQTATIKPIRYLGAEDSLGYIKAGYIADLVLYDQNPLTELSIENVQAVVLNGLLLNRTKLDSLESFSREQLKNYSESYP